jgi:endonuclease/exonuclease/phosphatase family metal-dependent hydrolase
MSRKTETAALALKLLTLNVHKGFTILNRRFVLHELREAVRSTSADVVFLQEVLGSHSEHQTRHKTWPTAPQYEFLADTIWGSYAYGRNAVYTEGHHGNAVLSKFPIVRYDNHDISVGRKEKRGLLHCVIKAPGREIEMHAICVHLSLMESHRRQQLGLLCDRVADSVPANAPLFIAGDFNDWRLRAHSVLELCAGLKEAFVETQGQAARTFPSRWPLLRLDRIYFRNAHVCASARWSVRPWSHLSDHAALTAELEL